MRSTATRLNATRTRKISFAGSLIAMMLLLLSVNVKAQTYTTVPVTGFTDDIIANGPTFAGSVTATVDAPGGYYFYNQSFTAFGTTLLAYLPNSGTLNSLTTPGLTFQLANATGNNSLRLAAINASGTLTLASATGAGIVYLAVTSGSGASVVDVTVNFTDATSQTFTGQTISDWFGVTTNNVVRGIGRTSATAIDGANNTATATDPRIYQIALPLSPSNYSKLISSITVTKTNATGTGYAQIMAVSVAAPCAAPTAQPTGLVLTAASPSQINGTFAAATPAADQYLVVRYATGATPTDPVNGTTYSTGASLGSGTVVFAGAATSFSSTGLNPSTAYTYYVYAFNATNCVGPVYLPTNPLTGSQTTSTCGTMSGTFSVGPTGTYPSITAALTALSGGISGNVILELEAAYNSSVETFPITFNLNPCFGPTKTLTIRPIAGATALSLSSANTTATVDLNGAKYVTIDGRPGGTGTTSQLSIINTAATGVAVRFINDAQNNTINYCDVQGQNTTVPPNPALTTVSGVIYFGGTNTLALQGNDNNSISNSSIHATAGGNPVYGILAAGTTTNVASYNDNNTITNCNIYDFFSAASATVGIKLDAGTNAWTITNNSFYQTAARTYTGANTHRAIWITPNGANIANTASGFVVTGNFIGGSAPLATGAAYTIGGAIANVFNGMDISVGLGTPTSIQNNTITNLAFTSSSAVNPYFAGISVVNGHVNIGTVTGNIIGAATGNGAITMTTSGSGGTAYGIRLAGGTSVNQICSNNTIGSITINNAGISTNFIAIAAVGGTTTNVNITNNIIGSTTTANSLNLTGTGTTTAQSLSGIVISSGAAVSTVIGNTIANLTNGYTSTGAGQTRGIAVSVGATTINNNNISNLRNATNSANSGASSALLGISMTSSTTTADVIGNTIHSLISTSTSTSAIIQVEGIFYSNGTAGGYQIAKNFIHSLDVAAANNAAVISGVDYATGTATFVNNMIRLGIRPDGSPITNAQAIRGISSNSSTTANNFYHNSIYIGGAGVISTTSNPSYAFIRTSNSGTYDIRNNILVNNRSNATTGGKHFALYLTGANTGVVPDYNVYYVNGTGGVFAFNGTADVNTYTSGWLASDVHSYFADPLFVNPTGTSATVDLHLQTGSPADGTGVDLPFVTDDIDGQVRSGFTPVDIGADAGNYGATGLDVGAVLLVSPSQSACFTANQSVVVRIKNFSSTTINFATNNVTVNATATGPVTYNGTATVSTGTLAAGATLDVTLSPTVNMTTAGTYVFNASTTLTGDGNTSNNAIAAQNLVLTQSIGGVYPVGAGQAANGGFNTLTAAVAAYNAASCINAPVVFQLTDATYTGTTETFPITINANAAASSVNTLTIKPAAGMTPSITGSVNSGGLIKLNGADFIIIDGSNNGTATRDLTITNSSTTAPTAIALVSLGNGAGAINNTIKNLNIATGVSTSASYGVAIGGATPGSNGADNDNNTVQNNVITIATTGIYAIGTSPSSNGGSDNLQIIGNNVTTNTSIATFGIQVGNSMNSAVNLNTVSVQTSQGSTPVGISLETGFINSVVLRNNVLKVLTTSTGGWGGRGITVGTGAVASNLTIANNFISNVNGSNFSSFSNSSSIGIAIGMVGSSSTITTLTGGVNIYYNTVNLNGTYNIASNYSTAAIYIGSGATGIDVRNNIFVNTLNNTAGAGSKAYSIYSAAAPSAFTAIDFNDYYGSGSQSVLGFLGSDLATIAAIQGAFGQNAGSKNIQPLFVSNTDLHLLPGLSVLLNGTATPIASVTTDIDLDVRNATTPDMGADEFTPPAVDVFASTLVEPFVKNCYSNAETVKVSIKNFSATSLDFSNTPVTVTLNVTGATTATQTLVLTTGIIAPGDSLIVTFPTPLNMSVVGTYTFNASASSPLDVNTGNDAMAPVTRTLATLVPGTVAASASQICTSGIPVLSLTGLAGGNIQWQEATSASGPWANVGTNSAAYSPAAAITATTFYQAVVSCNAATATTNTVQVTVNNPQVLTTNGATRCGPGTLNLTATASAGATLSWYTTATGGTAIGTGVSFTTPIINTTTTYYVGAEFPMTPVCSSTRTAVTATVTAAPAFDITNDLTVCNNAITTIAVTTPTANFNTYTWAPSAGLFTDAAATIAYTGTSATTVYSKLATAGTFTFVATANNTTTGCQNIDSVRITVLPSSIAVLPAPDQLCVSGTSTVGISVPASSLGAATYQWSNSTNNVTYNPIGGATAPSYTTPTITATTFYKIDVKNSAGQVCLSPYDTVIVNNPSILTTTPATICGTGTLNLAATANAGSTINWYTAATGGSLAGTGSPFTTPSLSATTTYYAAAVQGGGANDVGIKPADFFICGNPVTTTATGYAFRFNTTKAVIINSTYVVPAAAGAFTVALRQSLQTTDIVTATFNFTAAQVGQPVLIPLGFSIPTPGSYQLVNTAGGIGRITTLGCGFPFNSPSGAFSIVGSATSSTTATVTTAYNGYFQLNVTEACESPRVAVVATVNTTTAITTQPQSQAVCAGANVTFSVVAAGTNITYQWKKGATVITGATSATYTINNAQPSDNGTYTVDVTGICGAVTSTAVTLSVSPSNAWLGVLSSDWSTPANWCGAVPTSTSDVVIPAGTPFSPQINGSADVRNLTINAGATVNFTPAAQLNIYGNYASSGTLNAANGFIYFRGATNQSVGTLTATNVVMNGAGGITLGGNMNVTTLILQNGNITLGTNNLVTSGSVNGSVTSHIVTNGTGSVISNNIGAGPVIIPVGADAATYNPVMIANGQNRNYTVRVATGIAPAIADPTRAINRTWSVTPSAAVTSDVSVTLQFANAHGNANFNTAGAVEVGLNQGSIWFFASPANGLIPLGAATERQVTVQTQAFGSLMISSPGGMSLPTSVTPVNPDINSITVLPNPVSTSGMLRVVSNRSVRMQWRITDVSGRIIATISSQLIAGTNNISLPVSMITSGNYYVTGVGEKGKTNSVRFIKL